MKILYAIQATGNGHISRAKQIIPFLEHYGKVDVMLSGTNASLVTDLQPKFKSSGLSLFYKSDGGISYKDILFKNKFVSFLQDAHELPVEDYDMVINDFDAVTALACKLKKKKCVHVGHQTSFASAQVPRPQTKERLGEWVLKNYAPSTINLGFHFESYDDFVLPPIIKQEIVDAQPTDKGHICVYLPAFAKETLIEAFQKVEGVAFEWFIPGQSEEEQIKNVKCLPTSYEGFTESLIHCHGVITGAGFETPAEALYLQKRLMATPIANHYEQKCNAAALKKIGVKVLDKIDPITFHDEIKEWLVRPFLNYKQQANDIETTIKKIMELGKMN